MLLSLVLVCLQVVLFHYVNVVLISHSHGRSLNLGHGGLADAHGERVERETPGV